MGRLRLRHVWLVVPLWMIALRAGGTIRDNSFLWHVRAGMDQLADGRVITVDPYSLTVAGEPWRTQSWLAELGYGQLETWFPGLAWSPWVTLAMLGGTFLVLTLVVRARSTLTGTVVVLVALAWVAQASTYPRPAAVGYLLLALLVAALQAGRPVLWALPGLFWLWAGIHGTFVIGLGVVALEAIRLRSTGHVRVLGLSAVAVSLTAHGAGIWEILFRFLINRDGLSLIQEWMPPEIISVALLPVLGLLALLMMGLSTGRVSPGALWVIVPVLGLALTANRNVFPALIVLAPWLGRSAGVMGESDRAEGAGSAVVAWCIAAVLTVWSVVALAGPTSFDESRFPPASAVAAVAPGPVFHDMATGGYLIYLEGRQRPVVIDDRVELYGADRIREWHRVTDGIGWSRFFETWSIEQALVSPESGLAEQLRRSGWSACRAIPRVVLYSEVCD